MKKWIIGIVLVLALAGCDAYLPADMRIALDQRIVELEDIRDEAECRDLMAKDLELLTQIREAIQ